MYGKIQDCGLTKIIPFISAIWCQYPVFCPSWTSLGLTIGSGCSPDAANHRYYSPSWVSLGLTSSHWRATITDDCDILVYWSVQLSSVTQSCLTLCDHMDCSTPGFLSITNSWSLLKLVSIESVMPSNHLIFCHPLLLLPSIFLSMRVFSNELALCIRLPKCWSFSFKISPTNEHPGLISFRMDWLDLIAVQGTLKSLLQHHSSKASILQPSASFIVQLSHPYMTTGKTIALTRWTFVCKIMSLLFNMLSRLVIAFLPRSKCLLISWLQSPCAVILEPPKIKSDTVSIASPSICHEVMGPDAMILVF